MNIDKLKTSLIDHLEQIKSSGSFESSGVKPFAHPGLHVQGVGEVALPLSDAEAQKLVARAHKAPFGKGSQTITDTTVRSAWELDADQISFQNPQWEKFLDGIVAEVKKGLGLEKQSVKANLYKLLLYETGDFFLPHKDSEKEKGMFGTLVVGLPSKHTGGELVIRFDGREKTVDFSDAGLYNIPYAAFYADCDHEIKPVRSGIRLALVYNLVQSGKGSVGQLPRLSESVEKIAAVMTQVAKTDTNFPKAVLLNHQYTPANFSQEALKLDDLPRALTLLEAAEKSGCFACLGLVTHYFMGDLEYDYSSRKRGRRYRDYDDDEDEDIEDGTMGEVFESSLGVEHWLMKDTPGLGDIDFEEEDVWTKQELDETGEPIEKEAEGYTGNAGMTIEYWYHYGAVIFWPKQQQANVLMLASSDVQLNWLDYYCKHWGNADSARIAHDLMQKISDSAPPFNVHEHNDYTPVANLLLKANDEKLARQHVPLLGVIFHKIEIGAWLNLLQQFEPKLFAPAFEAAANRGKKLVTTHLLEVLVQLGGLPSQKAGQFRAAQIELLPSYIGGVALTDFVVPWTSWQAEHDDLDKRALSQAIVVQTLILSCAKDDDNAWLEKMLAVLIADPFPRAYVNRVLVPLLLNPEPHPDYGVLGDALSLACKQDLAERVGNPPVPPPNWRREVPKTTYKDANWETLRPFLESPTERVFEYRRVQADRTSMENTIRSVEIDLQMETIRSGSPHLLRITKTQGAYEKAKKEWQEDKTLLRKFE